MKKILYSLMFLPMLAIMSACSDSDNDLPEVDMQVTISGGIQNEDDNKIYVEQGTPLVVESVTAIPRNGKKTTLGLTTYYLNGLPQYQTVTVPFSCTLSTTKLKPGEYSFQIKSAVYQVDKTAAFVLMSYDLVVEEPQSDEPATYGRSIVRPDTQQLAEQ
ncbi:MAG: hypothetical protein K2O38_02325 [Muribaculaceae bacterium]|nr:hypothetical protein [Muribaculaceae bacterium]